MIQSNFSLKLFRPVSTDCLSHMPKPTLVVIQLDLLSGSQDRNLLIEIFYDVVWKALG